MNLILAAGTQSRWTATSPKGWILPKIKQLVQVDDMPLIVKIQQQFTDSIVVTNNPEIKLHSVRCHEPEQSEVTIATLFSTRNFWEDWTTILLGDVIYGRTTRKLIKNQKEPLMFYGDKGEIYAIKFRLNMSMGIMLAINKIVNSPDFKPRFGKLWNLYRALNGVDFRKHYIGGMFTHVSDCQDFDNKEQYIKYAKSKKIRS